MLLNIKCGIEFKTEIPILLKDSFIFTVLENFPEKHSLVSERFDTEFATSVGTHHTDIS